MKILHICVTGPYTDGFNYQENLLTKYQVKYGYEVHIIASEWQWGQNGRIEKYEGKQDYKNAVGVMIHRLKIKGEKDIFYRYKRFEHFYETIEKIKPDVIFVHNLQFFDVDKIVKYAKKHKVTIFVDNHADFSNSARNTVAKAFYKTVWRYYAKKIEPFTKKFYGVLPSRVDFLIDIYGLPKNKCELLVMGGDDELIRAAEKREVRNKVRNAYSINDNDFLIVTGGKIDEFKTQTVLLMKAIQRINNPKLKFIFFGSISDSLKEQVDKLTDGVKIQNAGWIKADKSYEYFAAADLVIFPGRHSVFWEQVVAQGIPLVCKRWDGATHVDVGGNVVFIDEDSIEAIEKIIKEIMTDKQMYLRMLKAAKLVGKEKFSYRNISIRAIML